MTVGETHDETKGRSRMGSALCFRRKASGSTGTRTVRPDSLQVKSLGPTRKKVSPSSAGTGQPSRTPGTRVRRREARPCLPGTGVQRWEARPCVPGTGVRRWDVRPSLPGTGVQRWDVRLCSPGPGRPAVGRGGGVRPSGVTSREPARPSSPARAVRFAVPRRRWKAARARERGPERAFSPLPGARRLHRQQHRRGSRGRS